METQLQLGDITVDVVLEDIKNVHLRVYAISKLDWIKRRQTNGSSPTWTNACRSGS